MSSHQHLRAPIPLPRDFDGFPDAYQRCIHLEREAVHLSTSPHCPEPVVCARILGHLLRLASDSPGRDELAQGITSAAGYVQLMELARLYNDCFIRAFKSQKGPTPKPYEHPSLKSFETAREEIKQRIKQADRASIRETILRRDNHCILTGRPDVGQNGNFLEAIHIIPAAVNAGICSDADKCFSSAGTWTILTKFANWDIVTYLEGEEIHRPENLAMMSAQHHKLFDRLLLWLKPQSNSNTYTFHIAKETLWEPSVLPTVITLSTETDIPLPHPTFFALHALCCEVAWMSGAGCY